jgi:plastocyanin domain-containing protein
MMVSKLLVTIAGVLAIAWVNWYFLLRRGR